jgi:hypothetical protein
MHVHAVKGDADCKYWLLPGRFDIVEDFEYDLDTAARTASGAGVTGTGETG